MSSSRNETISATGSDSRRTKEAIKAEKVVYFYSGHWCIFTPALTPVINGGYWRPHLMNFVQTHRQFLQRHVRRRFNPAKDIFAVRIKTPLLRRTGFDRDRPLVLLAPGKTHRRTRAHLKMRRRLTTRHAGRNLPHQTNTQIFRISHVQSPKSRTEPWFADYSTKNDS